jgi:hypothetical protein
MGYNTIASGAYSTAMGSGTKASFFESTATGLETTASGEASIATGGYTTASGNFSTAIGLHTIAAGGASAAIGSYGQANAIRSIVIGEYVTANSLNSISLGRHNDPIVTLPTTNWILTEPLLILGNGIDTTNRKNALVILKNGNTGLGTNSPNAPLQFSNTTVNRKIVLYDAFNNDHQYFGFGVTYDGIGRLRYQVDNPSAEHVFYAGATPTTSTWLFTIKGDGNAFMPGVLSQSSDARLKTNIFPITSALSSLLQLNAYHYQWKNQSLDQSTQVGIIAQEVQKLFPELVKENAAGELSVTYSGLIPLVITAMKEQQSEIKNLKSEMAELKKMVEKSSK